MNVVRVAIVGVSAISTVFFAPSCGSTSPVAPTAPPSTISAQPALDYASLPGVWVGNATLVLQFTDTWDPFPYGCRATASVSDQGGGRFFIGISGIGAGPDSDR